MKARSLLLPILLLSTGAGLGALAQERVKPKGPADFDKLHMSIKTNYHAKHYGQAYAHGKELLELIGVRRSEVIRAAIPDAAGYTKVPLKKNNAAANAMLAGMSMAVGNIIVQEFKGGPGSVKATVTTDSPMVQMMSMLVTNPALLKDGQELIKYQEGMALVETRNNRVTFQMVIGKSLIDCTYNKHDVDYVLGMWSQKAISGLAMTLGQ